MLFYSSYYCRSVYVSSLYIWVIRLLANLVGDSGVLFIYDARPKLNAVGNQIAGKGYESTANYRNCMGRNLYRVTEL